MLLYTNFLVILVDYYWRSWPFIFYNKADNRPIFVALQPDFKVLFFLVLSWDKMDPGKCLKKKKKLGWLQVLVNKLEIQPMKTTQCGIKMKITTHITQNRMKEV